MSHADVERLRAIKTFPALVKYLRDELEWPIESEDVEDLTFEYDPEELGIDLKTSAKIQEIKQLRPVSKNQPWGIFFLKFEPKRLPVTVLRRVLSRLVVKKRQTAAQSKQAVWHLHDLLFISSYGEGDDRQITFAHFTQDEAKGDLPTLKVLGWDDQDTRLHMDHAVRSLKTHFRWPANEANKDAWRDAWSAPFASRHREAISTAKDLAGQLAGLAMRIRSRVNQAMEVETAKGPIRKLYKAFQEALIHDLTEPDFADMYAQTITYGLLAARVSRPLGIVADNLSELIPVTNPFLKEMLETFLKVGGRAKGGLDFDELGIHEVVEVLNDEDTHIEAVLREFNNKDRQEDPVIHFYEDFLRAYDPEQKKQRGVFYTPQPVVSYIVRSVHESLQGEFGLEDGLASTATWEDVVKINKGLKIPLGTDPKSPFVQILDPATGTGTFLVEVIEVIHQALLAKWKGQHISEAKQLIAWNEYVPSHLLPRLHGYELMMAPYAIAHLKIGLKLYETKYDFNHIERARIFLTNSLEPAQDFSGMLEFAVPALAHEAEAVNKIKRKQRFTVIIGNPPYAGHSANTGEWISSLLRGFDVERGKPTWNYFEIDGLPLGERNPKYLNDDYVKFIKFSQSRIDLSEVGVLAFITNHGYLDNPTFRGMRQCLCQTFNDISILDLHGNANKKECDTLGRPDENVFEIRQGVAVGIFIRKNPQGIKSVKHADIWGSRDQKLTWLGSHMKGSTEWDSISCSGPTYGYFSQDERLREEYDLGWPINRCFNLMALGSKSHRDDFAVSFDSNEAARRLSDLRDHKLTDQALSAKYEITDTRDWNLSRARKGIPNNANPVLGLYRPFDFRYLLLGDYAYDWPRPEINQCLIGGNIALAVTRQTKEDFGVLAVSRPVGQHKIVAAYDSSYICPLYRMAEHNSLNFGGNRAESNFNCNLSEDFLDAIKIGISAIQSNINKNKKTDQLTPETVFNYIYGIFHSPSFRSRYADFLKLDYPRVPIPQSRNLFEQVARIGQELISLHIMESSTLSTPIATYHGPRNPQIDRVAWINDTVWLDSASPKKGQPSSPGTIGFIGVPEAVWLFHIGGNQVCEKWLKDRKGRILTKEDIAHYQKIVVAISETIRIMGGVDTVIEAHGGWPGAFAPGVS